MTLKNCPCCDGKARLKSAKFNILGAYGTKETDKQWYSIYCTSCKLSQPKRYYFTKEEAEEAWNKRV